MKPDINRFENARNAAMCVHERFNIGTYKERSQHLVLKHYYEPDRDCHEISCKGHIADIKNGDGIIEIQTSAFSPLVKKLEAFLPEYRVKIVYPCNVNRRICWINPETGESLTGNYRNYPKKIYSVLPELLRISEFFGNGNLSVDLVLCAVTENRLLDGYGADRKKRATKADTFPDEIIETVTLRNKDDIFHLLELEKGGTLTQSEMSKRFSLSGRRLWMAVKCLETLGIISLDGKIGNKKIYTVK
ncbi:MAG: hypothetical protein PUC29_01990 [Clostridia bacterium]|nr:hypothetical protein [Clostridia bacterium]